MLTPAGGAVRVWVSAELRHRRSSLVLLGVLAGVAAGLAIAAFDGAERSGTAYSRGWFDTIERAKVIEGRLPDPSADDEAVIKAAAVELATEHGLGVGSVLTWRHPSKQDVERFPDGMPLGLDWTTLTGPVTKLRIVGVVRMPMDSVASFASGGLLLAGPGWETPTSTRPSSSLPMLSCGCTTVPPTSRSSKRT